MATVLQGKDTELGLQVYLAAIYFNLRVTGIQHFKVVGDETGGEVFTG